MAGLAHPAKAAPGPGEATAGLTLQLFGPMEVRVGSRPLPPLHSRKGLWLLALLALRGGRDVERDWLAATLWPDNDTAHGRRSLRQSLYDLRQALGPEARRLTAVGTRTLRLDLESAAVDALAFDAAVARGDPDSLAAAARLYRGPLLEDCAEEWVYQERRRREQACVAALATLAAAAAAGGEHAAAAGYLQHAVEVDPFREDLQRALMQALFDGGNPSNALLVYRRLSDLLHREMAGEPAPETTALFRQLRDETRARLKASAPAAGAGGAAPPSRDPGPAPQDRLAARDRAPAGWGEAAAEDRDAVSWSAASASSALSASLPLPLTELIGRREEVRDVAGRLESARLVTLTGTGGIGKTRLALQVATQLANQFRDGVWFMELAPLSDASLVAATVARTLGLREPGDRPPVECLGEALRDRELLLALDNCEHLVTGCAELADHLLRQCAGVRILATSQQPLGLLGEVTWRVPSLPSPRAALLPAGARDPVSHFLGYAAVRLFVTRAQEADRRYRLTAEDAATVAQICRRLDGIPLAIELAAARVRAMRVDQIAQRLDDRFRLLTGGSRAALPRQQTLRGAIDWSYDLLAEPERQLLRRLSVFAGGWTLEAAEAVVSGQWPVVSPDDAQLATDHWPLTTYEVLDLLTSLVEKSLVIYEEQEGRYHLLETVRHYAQERLAETGEAPGLSERHLNFFLAMAEEAEPHLKGAEQTAWWERLETEHDNLRAALEWSRREAAEAGLRLAGAIWRFWKMRGYLAEGRERLRELLRQTEAGAGPGSRAARARALNGAGVLALWQGDYGAARRYSEESLLMRRELGDREGIAESLNTLGSVASFQGDHATARALCEECLASYRELGDRWGVALSLTNLGRVAYAQGDYAATPSLYEEALALFRELGDKGSVAVLLKNLGRVATNQRDFAVARTLFEEGLALFRELGDKGGIADSLLNLGRVARSQGDDAAARSLFEQSLTAFRELGDRRGLARSLMNLGRVATNQGDLAVARTLFEEGLVLFRELGQQPGSASCLMRLGHVAYAEADEAAARARYDESLAIYRELGDRWGIAEYLARIGCLAALRGGWRRAGRLWGAAAALREASGAPPALNEPEPCEREQVAVREALGEEAFTSAWAEGRAMTLEEALAETREESAAA